MIRLFAVHDDPDPWTYYAAADLYVCSSRVESYPLSLQEAKAYGLPVITTPVFGCAEIVRRGIDGLHYQPGNVESLRLWIESVRDNPGLRASLSGPLQHLPSYAETCRRYEDTFRLAAGVAPRDQPLQVVYHVAGLGDHWKPIVAEQLAALSRVGLRRIYATHVGAEPDWVLEEAWRRDLDLTLCSHDRRVEHGETPAIRLIERFALTSDTPILYLHSKGVSHPLNEPVWHEWRRLMMRELVERWRERLPALVDYDAVGVNWWTTKAHFSGNFWLARADWLRKLPRFDSYYRDRYSCERWIGATPGCRTKSLVCSDLQFWDRDSQWMLDYCRARSDR